MRNIVLLLLALIALSACNIFGLRDSEPPSEEARWNNATLSWQLVLENLRFSYQDSRNAINYSRLFLSDFRFRFAQQDITDYGTDNEWTNLREQDMILNLHASYRDISLKLENLETPDEISADKAILYRAYELTAIPRDPSRETIIAIGRLELFLRRENGYWYISLWKDYRSSGDRTWGLLKHENG